MYGPGISYTIIEKRGRAIRNEPVFYNYFCSFRNDGGSGALYAGGGAVKRGVGNPTWIRNKEELKLIKKHADKWCRDNGYPVPRKKKK